MHALPRRCQQHRRRSGLTLPELLIASTIVAMMIGSLGALAAAVDSGHRHSHGRSVATQHGRVVLERIRRSLNSAHASPEFPAFLAFPELEGSYMFSDTLAVWRPDGRPADPDGRPLYRELVVYCPDPADPGRLWEVTVPGDSRSLPALSDSGGWATALEFFRTSESAHRVELTHLVRTASVIRGVDSSVDRAAIRFDVTLRPSEAQLQSYRDGDIDWDEINWVQGVYGESAGLRQAWCSVELQLMPSNWSSKADPQATTVLPFFASGAAYYQTTP